MITKQQQAFLDLVAHSEGTTSIPNSQDGYRVIVGSTPKHPVLFDSFADHPRVAVRLSATLTSTAAGRYQLLARFYDAYKKSLHLPDFSPASQDAIALQQIKECNALADIEMGNLDGAIKKCNHIWASLPGSPYNQHTNKMVDLKVVFLNAGGNLA